MDGPTEASADLPAPPAQVLAVIADLASYPQWVAGTTDVEVLDTDAEGRPHQARFAVAGGPLRGSWTLEYAWATAADGTGLVSWSLVQADVLRRLDGSHQLRAVRGGTRVTHRLAVELRVPVLGALRRRAERFLVERVLADLRAQLAERYP
jgi:ribosome-associated toxin RatA of RatAB toxin-antitoxin module